MIIDVEQLADKVISAGALEIRDVDRGEEPFLYSSGNRGPGYVSIKELVGQYHILKDLINGLAKIIIHEDIQFDVIAANVTGGVVPGWQLKLELEKMGREVHYVYVRDTRKQGGHKEKITGLRNNPLIKEGMRVLVFEELVNFAQTTCNSTLVLRQSGFQVGSAATILHYQNPSAIKRLVETRVNLVHLLPLTYLLECAHGHFSPEVIRSYKRFLDDPKKWQLERGYVLPDTTS